MKGTTKIPPHVVVNPSLLHSLPSFTNCSDIQNAKQLCPALKKKKVLP